MEHRELSKICRRFRAMLRGALVRLGVARLVTLLLALVASVLLLDYWLRFTTGGRSMAFLAVASGAALLVYFELVRPLRRRWSVEDVLHYLDRTLPESQDSLTVLAELTGEPERVVEAHGDRGRAILDDAVERLEPFVRQVEPATLLHRRWVRRWGLFAVGMAALFALGAATNPRLFRIGMMRLLIPFASSIKWPQETYIRVVRPAEAEVTLAQGESFTVEAEITGVIPDEVHLVYKSPNTRREIREDMKVSSKGATPPGGGRRPSGGMCSFTFPEVAEPITFRLEGGDDRTDRYTLNVIPRPRITKVVAAYVYPPYSRVPPKRVESGQIAGLEGTKVTVRCTASKQLRKASIVFGEGEPASAGGELQALALDTPTTFHFGLTLEKDDVYVLHLEDTDGLTEAGTERYTIRVTPDEPPIARITEPADDLTLTPGGRTRVAFTVTDDFGLTQVEFLYRVGEEGEPIPLTDRVTGPVMQNGKESSAHFTWDLPKMKGLEAPTFITYLVRAKDCNPSDKGISESDAYRIDVLTPLEYQTRIVLQAKRAITEARLAEGKQRWAYYDAQRWLSGEGKDPAEADALLEQALAYQGDAARAAQALDRLLRELRENVRSNKMERDFFGRRLDRVGELVRKLVDAHLPAIRSAIEAAKPKSAEEALPEARRERMRRCLAGLKNTQKLASLRCLDILHRLLDWRDLQGVIVQTRHLEKEQMEIHALTERETEPFIGKEVEDLSDAQARILEQIADRQSALGEAEAALEEELQKLIATSSREKRAKVAGPLFITFKGLKDNLINDRMRKAGEFIDQNKSHMVLGDQLLVAKALKFINQNLERAGADAQPVAPDAIAMKRALPEDERVKPETGALVQVDPEEAGSLDVIEDLLRRSEVPIPDEARLETVERYLQDLGDAMDVLRERTAYLHKRLTGKEGEGAPEMPGRYQRLRLGRLRQRHGACAEAAKKAHELSTGESFKPLRDHLGSVAREVDDALRFLERREIARDTQDLQAGVVASTRDLRRFLFNRNQQRLQKEDREEKGGKDEFDRDFVLAGGDLATSLRVMENLGWARVLQADVGRKARHLGRAPEGEPAPSALAKERTAKDLAAAEARCAEVIRRLEESMQLVQGGGDGGKGLARKEARKGMSEGVLSYVGPGAFRAALKTIRSRKGDASLAESLRSLDGKLAAASGALADLADARVAVEVTVVEELPPEVVPTVDLADPEKLTPEELEKIRDEFLKDRKPEAIRKRIEENEAIPAPVRERLLATLREGKLDAKYEMLLSAYFLELARQGK